MHGSQTNRTFNLWHGASTFFDSRDLTRSRTPGHCFRSRRCEIPFALFADLATVIRALDNVSLWRRERSRRGGSIASASSCCLQRQSRSLATSARGSRPSPIRSGDKTLVDGGRWRYAPRRCGALAADGCLSSRRRSTDVRSRSRLRGHVSRAPQAKTRRLLALASVACVAAWGAAAWAAFAQQTTVGPAITHRDRPKPLPHLPRSRQDR